MLPVERSEIENLHRQYIANVIYTIAGDDFQLWVSKKMNERAKRIAEDRDLNIKMDPEIYKIFKQSTSISGTCFSINLELSYSILLLLLL